MRQYSIPRHTTAGIDLLVLFVYICMEIYFWYVFLTDPTFWIGLLVVGWTVNVFVFTRIVWRERNYLAWKPKGG